MKEWESTGSEVPSLNGWSEVLAEVQARIAPRFARAEVRERVGRYLVGLIDRVERKNGWQLAEAIGDRGPEARTTPAQCGGLGCGGCTRRSTQVRRGCPR